MTDRPIIFSAAMVRALLEGRKTQTRRIYKVPAGSYVEQGRVWAMTDGCAYGDKALPYAPGDRLYVREAHALWADDESRRAAQLIEGSDDPCIYRADFHDGADCLAMGGDRWRPSIHMPRWASRITLTVTEVRVQRLQDISEADAVAEGIQKGEPTGELSRLLGCVWGFDGFRYSNPVVAYRDLWNSLHGPDAWDANPWVVAVSFTVERRNIDTP
jgi:hypothetical protein